MPWLLVKHGQFRGTDHRHGYGGSPRPTPTRCPVPFSDVGYNRGSLDLDEVMQMGGSKATEAELRALVAQDSASCLR